MDVLISDKNIIVKYKNHKFEYKLQWIIFGSKTSIDLDIAVYVEPDLINKCIGHYNEICYKLDTLLIPVLLSDKPINSCLAYWTTQVEWCQKGPIDESNNAYIDTFDNHIQQYDVCPIIKKMNRNVGIKILGATRTIVCMLIKSKYTGNIRTLLCKYLKLPEILLIPNLKLFIRNLIGRFPELSLTKTQKQDAYQFLIKLKPLRNQRNGLLNSLITSIELRQFDKIDNIVTQILTLCNKAMIISHDMLKLLDNEFGSKSQGGVLAGGHEYQEPVFLTDERNSFEVANGHLSERDVPRSHNEVVANGQSKMVKNINDGIFDIGWIAKACLKGHLLILQLRLLNLIDWSLVRIKNKPIEKYKKLVFQATQTRALYNNIELYDKSQLISHYPLMKPFLIRYMLSSDDLTNLTCFIKQYTHNILEFIAGGVYGLNVYSNEFDYNKKNENMVIA